MTETEPEPDPSALDRELADLRADVESYRADQLALSRAFREWDRYLTREINSRIDVANAGLQKIESWFDAIDTDLEERTEVWGEQIGTVQMRLGLLEAKHRPGSSNRTMWLGVICWGLMAVGARTIWKVARR